MNSDKLPATGATLRVLEAIQGFWAKHGYSPSVRDVAGRVYLSKSNAWHYISHTLATFFSLFMVHLLHPL